MAAAERKGLVWLVLLLALAGMSSASSSPAARSPARLPPSPPAPRRRSPFPPQPEPTDAELQTPPTSMSYPTYADLLWIQYAENAARPGPLPTALDLSEARSLAPRELTEFERWALAPLLPPGFETELAQKISSVSSRPRFERWALRQLAFDLAIHHGSPVEQAKQLQQRVGRSLYEQARDFYRGKG